MAIEVILPDSGRVEVTDTFRPRARALNGTGDSIAAPIFWSSLDTTLLVVVDSATGVAFAKQVGTPRLQARVGTLRTNPQDVRILPRLDTILRDSPERSTVTAPDSLSDSLTVKALATGGTPTNRRVVFATATYPPGGATITLVPRDTVITGAAGTAAVRVRFLQGTPPDSVVVSAIMWRLDSTAVPGSPVTFVVEFHP